MKKTPKETHTRTKRSHAGKDENVRPPPKPVIINTFPKMRGDFELGNSGKNRHKFIEELGVK